MLATTQQRGASVSDPYTALWISVVPNWIVSYYVSTPPLWTPSCISVDILLRLYANSTSLCRDRLFDINRLPHATFIGDVVHTHATLDVSAETSSTVTISEARCLEDCTTKLRFLLVRPIVPTHGQHCCQQSCWSASRFCAGTCLFSYEFSEFFEVSMMGIVLL